MNAIKQCILMGISLGIIGFTAYEVVMFFLLLEEHTCEAIRELRVRIRRLRRKWRYENRESRD